MGDKGTPFSVLKRVMATATAADYGKVSLAVIQRERRSRSRRMSMGLAPFFRRFELPWSLEEESERKFKKLLRILLIIATLLAILFALLPKRQTERMKPEDVRERVAQLIVEKPKPPPPPPPPEPEKKPDVEKPKPVETKPVEKPKPNVRNQGMLALQDELEALRDQNLDLADPQMKAPVADARSERNLITSQAGKASGGINTANMARGFGGGAGAIGTHATTQVSHGTRPRSECGRARAAHAAAAARLRVHAKKSRSCSIATRVRCMRSMAARCAISPNLRESWCSNSRSRPRARSPCAAWYRAS